jgi:single-stranded-DNA-specific exonuclease
VSTNDERRRISSELVDVATAQVHTVYGDATPAGIVVGGEGWHPGVGGIVAGRLAERFGVPAIVIALDGSEGVGSARAPKGFPLFDAVQACAATLEQFGGHDGAAGMRIKRERFEALRGLFTDACATVSGRGAGGLAARPDAELAEADLAGALAQHVEALEPTGQAHPEPMVLVRDAKVDDTREVGVGHLRARVKLGRHVVGMFIRDGVARRQRGEVATGDARRFDVLGHLRADAFAGPDAVQLGFVAMRPA